MDRSPRVRQLKQAGTFASTSYICSSFLSPPFFPLLHLQLVNDLDLIVLVPPTALSSATQLFGNMRATPDSANTGTYLSVLLQHPLHLLAPDAMQWSASSQSALLPAQSLPSSHRARPSKLYHRSGTLSPMVPLFLSALHCQSCRLFPQAAFLLRPPPPLVVFQQNH